MSRNVMIVVTALITSCQVSTLGSTHSVGTHNTTTSMQIVKNQPLETNWPVCVTNLSNTDRRKLTCEGIASALRRAAALAPDVTIVPILKRFQEPQPDLKSDAVRGGIARGLCASAAE